MPKLWLPAYAFAVAALLAQPAAAQMAGIRPAPTVQMPAQVDSNSPIVWRDGQMRVFNSANSPVLSAGDGQFALGESRPVRIEPKDSYGHWIESAWTDEDGAIYAWYHHEPPACGGALAMPEIGALVSYDGGESFENLGTVLSGSTEPDCGSRNGFFAGGHGDFSVIYDWNSGYFYFLFGNYEIGRASWRVRV